MVLKGCGSEVQKGGAGLEMHECHWSKKVGLEIAIKEGSVIKDYKDVMKMKEVQMRVWSLGAARCESVMVGTHVVRVDGKEVCDLSSEW
jgi:hypothetical protein